MQAVFIACIAVLSGCGDQPAGQSGGGDASPTAEIVAYAREARPADEALASIYSRSCRNCHAIAGVNAPLTGHVEDWEVRLGERGRDGLLKSTLYGYRAMPARGLCGNCSEEEFVALIDFMITPPE